MSVSTKGSHSPYCHSERRISVVEESPKILKPYNLKKGIIVLGDSFKSELFYLYYNKGIFITRRFFDCAQNDKREFHSLLC